MRLFQSLLFLIFICPPSAGAADGFAFSVSDPRVGEGAGSAIITITRTGTGPGMPAEIEYATTSGTATPGADYVATTGRWPWPPGVHSMSFSVPIASDTLVEGDETIKLTLAVVSHHLPGMAPSTGGPATLTIIDDDVSVAFAAGAAATAESGGAVTLTVVRSGDMTVPFSVEYATTSGSADPAIDFAATTGTLTFAAGESTRSISIPILDDSLVETPADESFSVALGHATGNVTLGSAATCAVTISDDDTTFSFGSPTYAGAEDGGPITATVIRAGNLANAGTQTVAFATSDGTASAGADYAAASGTLIFTGSAASTTVTLVPNPDATVESDETLSLSLSAIGGDNTVVGGLAVLTIANDDATVEFAAATVAGTEDGAAATITVRRNGLTSGTSTVAYATGDGSALAGSDYTAASGTLTFTAGQTLRTFTVSALADALVEGAETVTLTLSAPSGATLGAQAAATLTIIDDDAPVAATAARSDEDSDSQCGSGSGIALIPLLALAAASACLSGRRRRG